MSMARTDLLVSEDKRSYFINCRTNAGLLEVGAAYIAPMSNSPMTLENEKGVSFTVEISKNQTQQPTEVVAADTSFYIIS